MSARSILIACGSLAIVACASAPDDSSEPRLVVAAADQTAYETIVHPVVQRRCGSIDCHGQLPRGLRVYGENGLRLANASGNTPGNGATTVEEARATYLSILALEPERTNTFLLSTQRSAEGAYDLTFLSKALELERHRGGASLAKGEPAEQCLVRWLVGAAATDACTAAMR
jgi:hypothetical protein